jgi:hypothetical protein
MRQWWIGTSPRRSRSQQARTFSVCRDSLRAVNEVASPAFSARMRRHAFLLTGLIIGTFSVARAGERLDLALQNIKRPAALYASLLQLRPEICQPILDSLNKEFTIPDEKRKDIPKVALTSDFLLTSDLQLPWTQELVRQPDARTYKLGQLDFAFITLEGRPTILYRRSFEIHGSAIGDLTVNTLFISNRRLPVQPADQPLTSTELSKLRGKEILVDLGRLQRTDGATNVAVTKNEGDISRSRLVLLNVLAVGGETFVVAVDAAEAEIYALRPAGGEINLYVLQLRSAKDVRLACHFLGQ